MLLIVQRLILPFVTICFLLSFSWVDSIHAEQSTSASFFNGSGEINLIWNHALPAAGILIFSEVDTDAEIFEGGAAIADAAAESLLNAEDTGEVRTTVALDGIVSGVKALAHSRANAHNFFLLQNTSDEFITVTFNWTVDWFVSAVIDNADTDRSEMALHFTLAKSKLNYGSKAIKTMVNMLKSSMHRKNNNRRRRNRRQGMIFSQKVVVRLPAEGFVNYDSGGVTDGFEVTFGPKQTYLFGLSAKASGLASVSVEGCSGRFWKRHRRAWPIHPDTRFSDVFGVGPKNMSLWVALKKPQRKVSKPRFFSNAVTALLNSESPGISYYIEDTDALVALVKTTYESGNLDDLEEITDDLEFHNKVGASHICRSSLIINH